MVQNWAVKKLITNGKSETVRRKKIVCVSRENVQIWDNNTIPQTFNSSAIEILTIISSRMFLE